MKKVYILKRDLPWAKAGSEWEVSDIKASVIVMCTVGDTGKCFQTFPAKDLSLWFEEKKPEVEFSREQVEAIMEFVKNHRFGILTSHFDETVRIAVHESEIQDFLNSHTAKTEEEV